LEVTPDNIIDSMKMIIIVLGLPGSGKSYFASRLATRVGAEYINSDKVRKAMGALGRYSLQEKLAVYTEMAIITGKFLGENKNVVVDATFHDHSMRNIFLKAAAKRSAAICFIQVKASEVLIHERLKKPRADSEADFKVYQDIRDKFQDLTMHHLRLESTNDNISLMLNKAMDYIENVHEGK